MDVILLQDIEHVGATGSVVHVRPGFARNYLIPRGLAAAATPQKLKAVEAQQQLRSRQQQRQREEADALKQAIEGRPLTLTLQVGADGKSFGSVTARDLIKSLSRQGITIVKHDIQLKQPIKSLGAYEIPIRLHPDVTAVMKLMVAPG